jgi:putative FmdB family regulatory protein
MPTYDYRCESCGREFSRTMHMVEHDQGGIRCPDCGGAQVVQQYRPFFARTSRKS